MTTRDFHLGDVLSITTGRLLSPRGIVGVYDLLAFMTGTTDMNDSGALFCKDPCSKALLEQHPKLAAIEDDRSAVLPLGWLEGHVAQFGETLAVRPITPLPKVPT